MKFMEYNEFKDRDECVFDTEEVNETLESHTSQLNKIANELANGNIGNNVEPQLMDMPRIYFSEGALPTTKDATTLKFDYYSKTAEYHGWVEIKCQGNSSMSYAKKNFTIKLYKDKNKTEKLKIDFKGWGKQNKFVLKANWIDITHARNIVSARIWADIVKSRTGYANLPELLRTSPNQGAVDGFPVTVYGNGYYQGRYTLNIPKDKWMSNMDDSLDTHCILCGENYASGCFRATANINGGDWTDELHDTVPASIKTRWNECISFVMNSTDEEFKANLHNYFDVDSLTDYLLYGIESCGFDAFGKNQIYFTYDGQKWIASMYDMDSTWGLWWNGNSFVATDYPRESFEDFNGSGREGNLLYIRLQQLFINEIKSRYVELRRTIFTYPYLVNKFEEFVQICPLDIVKEDYSNTTANGAYTGIPSRTTNNIQQIRNYIKARLEYCDSYINSLVVSIPCTGITLSANDLVFENTTTPQTLTATLTPSNATNQNVTWTANNENVELISDGLSCTVKGKAVGNSVVTCTSQDTTNGTISDSCNVTVNSTEGGGETDTELVYRLTEATTFDGVDDYIDTGIQLFDTNKDFTVFIDFVGDGEQTGNNDKPPSILTCVKELKPWPGISIDKYPTDYRFGANLLESVPYNTTLRQKYIIRKNATEKTLKLFGYHGDTEITSEITQENLITSTFNANLLLGAKDSNSGVSTNKNLKAFWKGTINQCKVWFKCLTDDEINSLLS